MRKINLIILFILVISLIASCGINGGVDESLDGGNINDEKNIVEKPEESKAAEEKEKEEADLDSKKPIKESPEKEKEETKVEERNIEKNEDKKEIEDREDKVHQYTIASSNIPNLKRIEKKGYATVDDLNIRSLGSMKGKIITSIDKGVDVYIFGEKDNWYYVEYAKNKKGWVYSRYIQFNPIKEVPKDTSSLSNKSYNWYFVRNNKHKQPGFGSPHKALLDKYNGIAIGKANKKDIFLTFDNGYENGYTVKILDVLKRQNIKASFFVQGTYIDANPEIVKRMVKEGHIVLNHTNSHPAMPTLSPEKLQNEINITAEKYKKLTGKDMHKFLRPPSGVFSEKTLAETKKLGYRTVFWSMAYRDWVVDDQPGKSAAYKHVTDNIHNGAVILLHSVSKSNTEALEDIIKELKRQGYKFKLLSQYP